MVLVGLAWAGTAEDAVRAAVVARTGAEPADVSVAPMGLADGGWVATVPSVGPLCGNVPVVLQSSGSRHRVQAAVTVWQTVPVATREFAAGEAVDTRPERLSCTRLRSEIPVPEGRWQANVRFHAGDPVTTGRVRPLPDARSGAEVAIVIRRGGLVVSVPGRLLEDAWRSRQARVVNEATHAIVEGILQPDGTVQVGGS
jgi:flagella basal body P-ring formation protein FlgA